jgi:membrane-bound lytic murein transglycosylase B
MTGTTRAVALLSMLGASLFAQTTPPVVMTPSPAGQAERPDFATFLASVRTDARARGISERTLELTLGDITEPLPIVLERDRAQAEAVLSIEEYIRRRVTPSFVRTARQMAARHGSLLKKIGDQYAVQSRFVVAIWGLESNFGRFTGVRPTIQALATLAWDGRRGPFFRGELLDALEIIERGYIGADQLKGSWAGAMGQPQFMPSSYLKWAQDFDQDGDRDIWRSEKDIFASIANYLKAHEWSDAYTWGREVRAPASGLEGVIEQVGLRPEGCRAERQMSVRLPLSRWRELGVRRVDGGPLPDAALEASLVPAGRRVFLVYPNYETILDYNCAHSYALSVALLADRIGQ